MKFVEKTRQVADDFFDLVISLPQNKFGQLIQFLFDLRDLKAANQKEEFRAMYPFLLSKNEHFRELFAWFVSMNDHEFNQTMQSIHVYRLMKNGTFRHTKM